MRMRKKRNLLPRLERCAALIVSEPESERGRWLELAPACRELHLEIGCGKGQFTAVTALNHPEALLVAVERVAEALVIAAERALELNISNLRFLKMDARELVSVFAPGEISLIYLNFCDPWPKKHDAKRRLTAPAFLDDYKTLLRPGGEIHFKTDNLPLFEYSLETFEDAGFRLREITRDLHRDGVNGVMTNYEERFHEQGIKINRLCAIRQGD